MVCDKETQIFKKLPPNGIQQGAITLLKNIMLAMLLGLRLVLLTLLLSVSKTGGEDFVFGLLFY